MKKLLLLSCLLTFVLSLRAAAEPHWLTNHMMTDLFYYGVGSASLDSAEYQEIANKRALQDMAQQIMVRFESDVLFVSVEENLRNSESFINKAHAQATDFIAGQELEGRYTDKKTRTYYVCYRLDRAKYKAARDAKSKEIAAKGYDYLLKGEQAMQKGELKSALKLFEQGVEVVSNWLFLPLELEVNGQSVCVSAQLYTNLLSVYDGLRLSVSPASLHAEAFTAMNEPIELTLTRQGIGIASVPVTARFESGDGLVENEVKTNDSGVATFHLTRLTGKEPAQSIRFTLGAEMVKEMQALSSDFSVQSVPECRIQIIAGAQPKKGYLSVSNNDLPAAQKQVENVLTANTINLAAEADDVDLFIDMDCSLEVGGVVKGELYDLTECLVSLTLKFYNYRTNDLMTTYTINNLRVLCNEKNSYEQSVAQCTRELMKRVRIELPKTIKTIQLK